MIILDTNVISGLMNHQPDEKLIAWMDKVDPELFWTTAITVFEIKYGIELMTKGKKRQNLLEYFEAMLREDYRNRIIEFDKNAALAAGALAAQQKRSGNNIEMRDLQIAGIAMARGAIIATRNTKDFLHEGIDFINPWSG